MYIKTTAASVPQALAALEEAVTAHGFGVLHRYDFRETLAGKGFPIDEDCHVLEICNPRVASEVLRRDMKMNMALPCRVSVYSEGGQTHVGMIEPTAVLGLLSTDEAMKDIGAEVEASTRRIIDDAVATR